MVTENTDSGTTTLIVARDPGAAAALIPVARRCGSAVIGLDAARPVFERAGIPLIGPQTDVDAGVAEEWIRTVRPSVLVSGTSRLEDVPRDARWWRAAQERQIPALAMLDHWIGYWERFTLTTRFDTLPDVITVMDEYAGERLTSLGCPGSRLVVTGHPGLDALTMQEVEGREEARAHWGVPDDSRVVLFVSEPIATDHGASLGYNESVVLGLLVEALRGSSARLVVKPHPREKTDLLAEVLRANGTSAIMETQLTGRTAMAGADTVVGMTSVLLLEAALAGRPVLSLQPGTREPWTEHFGVLLATRGTVTEAREWLKDPAHQSVLSPSARASRVRAAGFDGKAAERVCQLISELSHRPRTAPWSQ